MSTHVLLAAAALAWRLPSALLETHDNFVIRQLPTLQDLLDNRANNSHGGTTIRIEESAARRQSDELQESEFKLVTARLEHGVKAWRVHEAKRKHYESAVLANKTHDYQLKTPQAQPQGGGGAHEVNTRFHDHQ